MFISTYARDHRFSEDASESVLPWFASRFSAHRVPQETIDQIEKAIPNRLLYFDQHFNQAPTSPVLSTSPSTSTSSSPSPAPSTYSSSSSSNPYHSPDSLGLSLTYCFIISLLFFGSPLYYLKP